MSCLPGEHHELGILLFCLAAIGHGYRILYLRTDLPLPQIGKVVAATDVAAVLLSGTAASQDAILQSDDFADMVAALEVPLLVGGLCADRLGSQLERLGAHAIGAEHVNALEHMERIIPAFGKT